MIILRERKVLESSIISVKDFLEIFKTKKRVEQGSYWLSNGNIKFEFSTATCLFRQGYLFLAHPNGSWSLSFKNVEIVAIEPDPDMDSSYTLHIGVGRKFGRLWLLLN